MTWGCSYFHRDPFKQRTGKKLQAKEADTVIIAGMGGELEISILEAGKQLWSSIRHWIFSPQSDLEKVPPLSEGKWLLY